MLELSILEALKNIRNIPRKMHKSYLISVGYYDLIEQLVPYEKFGRYIKTTEPGYYWCHTRKIERISRYKTQKHKLKDFLKDYFDENLTETQNLENAGYNKIWDCGHKLYIV